MQIGNVGGSDFEKLNLTHQVTDCVHEHSAGKRETGGMQASSLPVSVSMQPESVEPPSLGFWEQVGQWFSNGKSFLHNIWNPKAEGEEEISAQTVEKVPLAGEVAPGPFIIPDDKEGKANLTVFQQVRERMRQVVVKAAGRFQTKTGSQFAKDSSLQQNHAKQQNDLRRRSHFKQDDKEIECVITDESYLLDSYDSKGEYSQLAAQNRHSKGRS